MIIITDQSGQMCNRIWAYAPFIARALHDNRRLLVLHFGQYAGLFENLNRVGKVRFVTSTGPRYEKAVRSAVRLVRKIPQPAMRAAGIYADRWNWGRENWPPEILSRRRSVVMLAAWQHPKDNSCLMERRGELRDIFKPRQAHVEKVQAVMARLRHEHGTVVGVHIRRGDYKTFLDGIYHYGDDVYAGHMRHLAAEAGRNGKPTAFLICSNEPVAPAAFAGLETRTIPDANGIEDLYALSLCDLIMGPPSTFSMWASFYGQVPLRYLMPGRPPAGAAEFSRIVAQNRFENGQSLVHSAL